MGESLDGRNDPEDQARLLNDVTALLSPKEEHYGRIWDHSSNEETRSAKQNHLDRMGDFFRSHRPFVPSALLPQSDPDSTQRPPITSTTEVPPVALSSSSQPTLSSERIDIKADEFDKKPIILLMVDGLRPDRFRQAAEDGLLPTLKSLFLDQRGTELASYTSRSLTLPSWSTILTGFEPDMHGIRSNTPASRIGRKIVDNFQDPRKDILNPKNQKKNRAFRRLEEDKVGEMGKVWLPGYFEKDEAVFNYLPVTNGARSLANQLISDLFKNLDSFFNDSGFLASNLDNTSAKGIASAIRQDTNGKLRLVMIWFSAVDEASHYNNRALPGIYKEIDLGSKLILDAAKNHPALKDATVFLLSDHGHNAGYGPFDTNSSIYQASVALAKLSSPGSGRGYSDLMALSSQAADLAAQAARSGPDQGPLLSNTGFNLMKFLAGDFNGYENYNFVVGASDSPEPKFYTRTTKKFQLQPFHETYPKHRGAPTALIDTAGDALAQIYIQGKNDKKWNQRLSYYELTHYKSNKKGVTLNIPADFLNFQLLNSMITDTALAQQVLKLTDQRPVNLFAMALTGKESKDSADRLGKAPDTGVSSREPVLVMSHGKPGKGFRTGLILTRSDWQGNDQFRYIVVKNFTQEENGTLQATVSNDPDDDPLDYLGNVDGAEASSVWRYDTQWLQMAKDHIRPTAVFALARVLTLAPKYMHPGHHELSDEVKKRRQGEIPDFLMTANVGYGFHSNGPLESDHGGLLREEVRNSFFVSSLDEGRFSKHVQLEKPVLSHDFMSTFLQYAGFGEPGHLPLPKTQGVSFKSLVDDANRGD